MFLKEYSQFGALYFEIIIFDILISGLDIMTPWAGEKSGSKGTNTHQRSAGGGASATIS